jgi:hypothetical protein
MPSRRGQPGDSPRQSGQHTTLSSFVKGGGVGAERDVPGAVLEKKTKKNKKNFTFCLTMPIRCCKIIGSCTCLAGYLPAKRGIAWRFKAI